MNPPPVVVMVAIKVVQGADGRRRTTVDATALHPDYDVTVMSKELVRVGDAIAADLSIRVVPRERPTRPKYR